MKERKSLFLRLHSQFYSGMNYFCSCRQDQRSIICVWGHLAANENGMPATSSIHSWVCSVVIRGGSRKYWSLSNRSTTRDCIHQKDCSTSPTTFTNLLLEYSCSDY